LVGQAPTAALKKQAETTVAEVPKVTKIYNQLSIAMPSSVVERSKDSWITTQVKTRLLAEKNLNSYDIKVITEGTVVYLMGNPRDRDKNVALEIARNIAGVTKVVDVCNDQTPTIVE
jgi:osmotically-inducible protein OsmY